MVKFSKKNVDFSESIKYEPAWLFDSGGLGERERRKDVTDFAENLLFFTTSVNNTY